ncbi:MAG TPA: pyrimidine-nucleoside phosphorylase [Chloroflexia bacterium]|nr:pyrimidine-nucleoside phosphorylase [Chloroflexia bacterium]
MRAVDIIIKKRGGGHLTDQEIAFFINGFTQGDIPDYQAAALAMAVYFQGMSAAETVALTQAMVSSGRQLNLSDIAPIVADKHSTGGVGDKTTMVVAPLVAATGLPVGKMSGRGLGYFGGTVDKLETIPGFRASLSEAEFRESLAKIGLVITGQSSDLAPADGKLYALRDVTGTVESLPLIASSVMSKKIAAGANCIVLDVKHGKGAFMKTLEDATALARAMTQIGQGVGRKVRAVLSSMEQPLGQAVGNALEVREAVETLQGHGPADLLELAFILGTQLLIMSERASNEEEARSMLQKALESGAAFEKYKAFVANQGGDTSVLDDPTKLPQAPYVEDLPSPRSGYIAAIDAEEIGIGAYTLGAGRKVKTDKIDPSVGLILYKKVGQPVEAGEPLLQIHAANAEQAISIRESLLQAYRFSDDAVKTPPLIDLVI